MAINGSTLISQTTLFIRDLLLSGITDPLSGTRTSSERFVMSAYPEREVNYPIITVKSTNVNTLRKGGMSSEDQIMNLPFEVRVWARNQAEKDQIAEQVHYLLRTNQITGGSATVDQGLFNFNLDSTVNVDELGKNKPKSKVMEISYNLVAI